MHSTVVIPDPAGKKEAILNFVIGYEDEENEAITIIVETIAIETEQQRYLTASELVSQVMELVKDSISPEEFLRDFTPYINATPKIFSADIDGEVVDMKTQYVKFTLTTRAYGNQNYIAYNRLLEVLDLIAKQASKTTNETLPYQQIRISKKSLLLYIHLEYGMFKTSITNDEEPDVRYVKTFEPVTLNEDKVNIIPELVSAEIDKYLRSKLLKHAQNQLPIPSCQEDVRSKKTREMIVSYLSHRMRSPGAFTNVKAWLPVYHRALVDVLLAHFRADRKFVQALYQTQFVAIDKSQLSLKMDNEFYAPLARLAAHLGFEGAYQDWPHYRFVFSRAASLKLQNLGLHLNSMNYDPEIPGNQQNMNPPYLYAPSIFPESSGCSFTLKEETKRFKDQYPELKAIYQNLLDQPDIEELHFFPRHHKTLLANIIHAMEFTFENTDSPDTPDSLLTLYELLNRMELLDMQAHERVLELAFDGKLDCINLQILRYGRLDPAIIAEIVFTPDWQPQPFAARRQQNNSLFNAAKTPTLADWYISIREQYGLDTSHLKANAEVARRIGEIAFH